MSQENVQKFYEASLAAEDTQLLKSLLEGTRGPADFIRNAVAAASEQGYEFTEADAAAWIEKRQGERQDRELSDHELETVAGGKELPGHRQREEVWRQDILPGIGDAQRWTKDNVTEPTRQAFNDGADWVASWF